MGKFKILTRGVIKNNPIFVLMLGMCPTLGTTTSAVNGAGMGIATMFVLVMSNFMISLLKDFIPDKVRIPAYVLIFASLVTMLQMIMEAYTPDLYNALGVFIPLIVVNCIILGRAEAFASKNSVGDSVLDGLGVGLGFTLALTLLGSVREMLGAGSLFGYELFKGDGIAIFILAPGAFIALGYLLVIFNKLTAKAK